MYPWHWNNQSMEYYILTFVSGLLIGVLLQYLRTQNIRLNHELLKEKYNLQEKFHSESSEKLELRLKDISQQIFERDLYGERLADLACLADKVREQAKVLLFMAQATCHDGRMHPNFLGKCDGILGR